MSAVVETKLIVTDDADDVLEIKTTPTEDYAYELRVNEGQPIHLTSDDADRLWAFLGADH